MSVFEIELIKEEMQVFIKPDVQNVYTHNSQARCILFKDQLLFTNQNKVITIKNEVFINSENHIVGISESQGKLIVMEIDPSIGTILKFYGDRGKRERQLEVPDFLTMINKSLVKTILGSYMVLTDKNEVLKIPFSRGSQQNLMPFHYHCPFSMIPLKNTK